MTAAHAVDGAGRVIGLLYLLFAMAAGSRAFYQIITRWQEAPLAFGLSALAAAVYALAWLGIRAGTPAGRRLALGVCIFELCGVLLVGTLTLLDPALFPRATVWSQFGAGYLFIPLILPLLGIGWIVSKRRRPAG